MLYIFTQHKEELIKSKISMIFVGTVSFVKSLISLYQMAKKQTMNGPLLSQKMSTGPGIIDLQIFILVNSVLQINGIINNL